MLTGERRGVSARRGGMTVLGKIPAVPKPINLPSQRLENRGLDPNVEIVPRGSVSWGSAGRSPPTINSAWGNTPPASSPPVSSGAWGSKPGAAPTVNSVTSGGGAWGGPGSVSRPTSGGSGTRPSSAGSIGLAQQPLDSTNSSNAWGARPSSASGVLGQAQSQTPASLARPRSADTSRPAANQFADSSATPAPPPGQAWGGSVTPRRPGEEPYQVSRFQLTRTDFPTLGSEKNPDLRPQHSTSVADRLGSVEEMVVVAEEGPPPTPPGHYEELPPPPTGGYGTQERGTPDTWRREAYPFQGPPPMSEGNWHREGPPSRPSYGGQGLQPDNWRRETPPSGGPADDNWRRGGAPPVGQYGPPPGPGHYPHEGPGYMHQARFGLAPAPYGRGAPGPGGFGHHGDMYSNAGPLLLPSGPMHPLRPNMFQGPVPYDGFYGPPSYRGMEESERMMMGIGGGPPFGGYPQHQGPPPPEAFGRYPHGGVNQGPRHPLNNKLRDRNEPPGEGYHESGSFHKEGNAKEGSGLTRGRGYTAVSIGRPGLNHDNDIRRGGVVQAGISGTDGHRQAQRGVSSGHQVGHRDWGAAASSDEPMDFSKPVFEEEVTSASSIASGKQSPAPAQSEGAAPVEEVKPEDIVITELKSEMTVLDEEAVKKEENMKVVDKPRVESVATLKTLEEVSTSKIPVGTAVEVQQIRDQPVRKSINVMDKDVLLKGASKEGPPKWERGSKRGDIQSREVIAPADGSLVTPSLSLGQQSSGLMGKSSILGNAPCSSTTDVLPVLDISHPPNLDKPASLGSPPASVSEPESQNAGEKVRILKRLGDGGPDSPRSDSTSGEAGVSENSVVTTPSVIEGVGKEGPKPKGRASSHDGEKEWRPKVPMAETSSRSSQPPVSKPVIAAPASTVADSSDTTTLEFESSPQPGSYDYEAQRAKMKEIAAQRARQLQIEEEERIKEQKAKARAKLEELDRRSTVPPAATNEEPPAEILNPEDEAVPVGEAVSLDSRPVIETGSSSSSGRRSSRNEPGKRDRDRKANVRKVGLGDSLKGKLNGSVSQPPPLLPSPFVATAPLLSTPVSLHEIHGQQAKPQQQSRHRGRPEKKQLAARHHDADRPMPAPLSVDIQSPGDTDGWNMGTLALQDTDSREVGLLNTGISEGASTPHKKKGNRTNRNRQRQEGPAVSIDGIQFGDLIMGPSGNGSSGSELPAESISVSLEDPGKDTLLRHSSNVSLSGDALTGDEGSAVSTNGDVPSKRVPRKSHGSRRTTRGERGSQDVRLVDKPHTNDSKVWAPVRSPGVGGGNKAEGADVQVVEPHKEDSSIAQQQARAKRAELERYTPKPVMKVLEQPILLPQRHTQPTPSSTIQAAISTPVDTVVLPRDFANMKKFAADVKANIEPRQAEPGSKSGRSHGSWPHRHTQPTPSCTIQAAISTPVDTVVLPRDFAYMKQFAADVKSNIEPRQADPGNKSGRSHGSWRQRGPGNNDRGIEGARDGLPVQHSSGQTHGEHVHQRPRFEQKFGGGQPLPRRGQPPSDQVPTTPLVAPAPASARAPVSTPVQALVQEREQAPPQRPYQPPRPTSAPAPRGQDPRAQGPYISEHKGHDQGTASLSRDSGAPSDRVLPSENAGSHHHNRTGGGHHMRQQGFEREQPPSQQVYTASHLQPKSVPVPPSQKIPGHSTPREREQQQHPPRGAVQHAPDIIDQGSHQRGRYEREQVVRPTTAPQRGQGHWQQTGPPDAFRSAPARPHLSERDLPVTPQFARMEVSNQQVADSQRPPQFQNKPSHASQQTAPVPIPTPKVDSGHWVGEGGSPPVLRGRDYNNHGRRGRFGGRSGPRGSDMEHRREHPPPTKQRLVIDATGGAVPSQVGG